MAFQGEKEGGGEGGEGEEGGEGVGEREEEGVGEKEKGKGKGKEGGTEEEEEVVNKSTNKLNIEELLRRGNLSDHDQKAILQAFEQLKQSQSNEQSNKEKEKENKENKENIAKDKLKKMQEKMTEIKDQKKEIQKWMSEIQEKDQSYKDVINQKLDQIVDIVNQRRNELIQHFTDLISIKNTRSRQYLQDIDQCYENMQASCTKIEQMKEERQDEVITEANNCIEKYLKLYAEFPTNEIVIAFQPEEIQNYIKKYGIVHDKKISAVQIQVKEKDHNSITLIWQNIEPQYINGDEFILEYGKINEENKENKENKEDKEMEEKHFEHQIIIKINKDENYQYCISNLQDSTNYVFRIQARHSIFIDSLSKFSNIVYCQTDVPCPLTLLSFNTDHICEAKDIVLEKDNTLIRNNPTEDYGRVSISFPVSNSVSNGTHCWRIKMCNKVTNIGWIMLAVVNANKKFTKDSQNETECWGYDGCTPSERNDSIRVATNTITWKWWMLNEYTVDMYINMNNKELKWKQVTEDGHGLEHILTDKTTFNKYNHLSLVPHINLVRKYTTVQVLKIPPQMYGLQLSKTEPNFR